MSRHNNDRWCGLCKKRTREPICPICWHRYGRAVPTNPYDPAKHKEKGTP